MAAIFMVGATGYIGGTLAERLVADGHEVRGLAHTPHAEAELLRRGHTPVRATLTDVDVLRRAAVEADAVVWTVMSLNPAEYPGMESALDAMNDALAGSGKPLLCMGGGIVYSDTGDGPVGEDGPLDTTGPMAAHALELEDVARSTGQGAAFGASRFGHRSCMAGVRECSCRARSTPPGQTARPATSEPGR